LEVGTEGPWGEQEDSPWNQVPTRPMDSLEEVTKGKRR
jgi:hypothetical protein